MPDTNYKLQSKPNILMICIMLFWVVGPGFMAYLFLTPPTAVIGASQKTGEIILLIFAGICSIFSILGIYGIFTFRSYGLTNTELIISRPLIFSESRVLLTDIAGFSEKEATISVARGLSFTDFSIGHKTTIKLKNGEQAVISSLEIWNYRLFTKKIQSVARSKP